ncbi:hypothetical protein [Priestia sp. LL-8]|uniref:hypothetical protein n=1 Tax=Priestia sp. LL-8 TaxID=3110068 RepID=UPI002E254BBE|nr:hypothetical protein [Priestia sp. LL-8]
MTKLKEGIISVTGDERYYDLIKSKLTESLNHISYNVETSINSLVLMIDTKCIGSLHEWKLDTTTYQLAKGYLHKNISYFKTELLMEKGINIKILNDNKIKKIK